jgi:cytochrome c oxidase subunit 4
MAARTHPEARMITAVTISLVVLLALTVILSMSHMGKLALAAALAIALIKATIVGGFFMDLRRAPTPIRLTAAAGLFWLIIILAGTLTDYVTRR